MCTQLIHTFLAWWKGFVGLWEILLFLFAILIDRRKRDDAFFGTLKLSLHIEITLVGTEPISEGSISPENFRGL